MAAAVAAGATRMSAAEGAVMVVAATAAEVATTAAVAAAASASFLAAVAAVEAAVATTTEAIGAGLTGCGLGAPTITVTRVTRHQQNAEAEREAFTVHPAINRCQLWSAVRQRAADP
jgi:hypothetical protein